MATYVLVVWHGSASAAPSAVVIGNSLIETRGMNWYLNFNLQTAYDWVVYRLAIDGAVIVERKHNA